MPSDDSLCMAVPGVAELSVATPQELLPMFAAARGRGGPPTVLVQTHAPYVSREWKAMEEHLRGRGASSLLMVCL